MVSALRTRSSPSARDLWATIVQYRRWVLAFLLVNALDSLTTVIGLGTGAVEANPIHASLIENSIWWTFLLKYAGVCLAIAFSAAILPWRMAFLKVLTVILGIVVISNLNVVL